jgi:hypothetical protein
MYSSTLDSKSPLGWFDGVQLHMKIKRIRLRKTIEKPREIDLDMIKNLHTLGLYIDNIYIFFGRICKHFILNEAKEAAILLGEALEDSRCLGKVRIKSEIFKNCIRLSCGDGRTAG